MDYFYRAVAISALFLDAPGSAFWGRDATPFLTGPPGSMPGMGWV